MLGLGLRDIEILVPCSTPMNSQSSSELRVAVSSFRADCIDALFPRSLHAPAFARRIALLSTAPQLVAAPCPLQEAIA